MKKRTKTVGVSRKPIEMNRIRLMRYHNDLGFNTQDSTSSVWLSMLLALLLAPMPFMGISNKGPTKEEKGS